MVGGIKLTMTCCRVLKTIIKNNGWADFNGGNPEEVKAETIISALREPHSDACRAAILSAAPHDTPTLNSVQSVVTVPGKWIPVSERMPEAEGHYLVWANASRIDGYCDHLAIATYQGGEWSNEFNWLVTHWMPLPVGPQEVKGE
ncbi:TPA: DUF551 domain-containing protein [Klebsiella michiganensis]|nr:DUF551 domain-containing protein [Klebsiella michiganensis]HCE9041174.1 DUF551 domain-containing protein [Klebsiella michiganensis]HCE9075234.1 DUF551 domain-containing protein [Klebsiella michiganensis]